MPGTLLFALNNEGRIFALSTNGIYWKEFTYLGIEFKSLSAVPHFLWAVGGDRQIYLHVHGLEIPIRVKEEAFENERWIPLEGFGSKLLPTDRHHFSNSDGTKERFINKIRLPSMAWQWDGDWHLELTLDGEPLQSDGWTYAVDFPATYHASKQWKSCVRRRKWVRYRKYSAMDSWCAIAPLHADPTQEPFIDVSVGGHQVPHAAPGTLLVWAVTAHSRVMFRSGVNITAPEGLKWINISVPPSCDVKKIVCGVKGLVWALLWSGRALVRKGVTRDCLMGESWLEIKSPDNSILSLISIGHNAVWALTADCRVWFRKGIDGNNLGSSETAAMGTGWLEVGGNMSHLSVSENDQVFAVGNSDKGMYWRMGIKTAELSGKKWKNFRAPLQLSRTCSSTSIASRSPRLHHRSLHSLSESPEDKKSHISIESCEASHSAPVVRTLPTNPAAAVDKNPNSYSENIDITNKSFETPLKNARAWSPVRSVGSVLGMEAQPGSDSAFEDDSGLYCEDEVDEAAWKEYDGNWESVEAGGCILDLAHLPHWLSNRSSNIGIDLTSQWRAEILENLQNRNSNTIDLTAYGLAVEEKGWSRVCEARFSQGSSEFEDCVMSLHWITTENCGTLSIFNLDGATIKLILNFSEISCVYSCSEPGNARIAIISSINKKNQFRIQFTNEMEQEDWFYSLTEIIKQMHDLNNKVDNQSLWATTSSGDILAWDFKINNKNMNNSKYVKEMTGFHEDLRNERLIILSNGFLAGSEIEIVGFIEENLERFSVNLQDSDKLNKNKGYQNITFHFNPRFDQNEVICNSKVSGEWGAEEKKSEMPFKKGEGFCLKITNDGKGFSVFVNNVMYTYYRHRTSHKNITTLRVVELLNMQEVKYSSPNMIIDPEEIIWRAVGGHLRKVQANGEGIVWGAGYDHSCWVYTGANFTDPNMTSEGIHDMTDTKIYFVYENQRWNPLSGYTSSGLPTDRYMWSDVTGRHKRTRENTKLLNRHWHWVSEWMIDYNTPGGVDKDGWQYATDFPTPYHRKKLFTDCVRRRRWLRKAQLITKGPWTRAGNISVVDFTFAELDGRSHLWAVTVDGDAVYRVGLSVEQPSGVSWEHVSSPQPLALISAYKNILWAVGRKGEVYCREDVTADNPKGTKWTLLESPKYRGGAAPSGGPAKCLSVSATGGWIVLDSGVLAQRINVRSDYIYGLEWKYQSDHSFKHVSANENEVWAVTSDGALYRRLSSEDGADSIWQNVISAGFIHLSASALDRV